jgi:hypothetical protein
MVGRKNSVRAVVIAMLAVSVVACQKSNDDDNTPATARISEAAKETSCSTPLSNVSTREQAEEAMACVGFKFNTHYLSINGGPQRYSPLATWDLVYYRQFFRLLKGQSGPKPSTEDQMAALTTYISVVETSLQSNGTPDSKQESKAIDELKDSKTGMDSKPESQVVEGESEMYQARVHLAKTRLSRLQARIERDAKNKEEAQKANDSKQNGKGAQSI